MKRLSVGLLVAACACAPRAEPIVMNACASNTDCLTGYCLSGFCAPVPAETSISVKPSAAATQAGGAPVEFSATIRNGSGEITWALNGPGSILVTTSGVTYTPPPDATTLLNATVTASIGTLSSTALISVNPRQGGEIEVSPSIAHALGGGAPITFTLTGGSPSLATWTLVGPGSLSNSSGRQTLYSPPATLDARAEAVLTATVSGQVLGSTARVFLEPARATLQVEVITPTMPNVDVTGPDGYTASVQAGVTTLSGLTPGIYMLTPARSRFAGSYVDSWWESVAVQATVNGGANVRVPIQYRQQQSTGALWLGLQTNPRLVAFSDGQLAAAPSEPNLALGLSSATTPLALAFAADGSLWILDASSTLLHFTVAQLSQSGRPVPDVTITIMGASQPRGLAFDLDGTLWVSSYDALIGVPSASLATSGTFTSASPLTTPGILRHFHGLALDSTGQLWVSDYGTNSLIAFPPASLRLGGLQTPAVTITTSGLLAAPAGLAFDGQGSLWVASSGAAPTGVTRFSAADLRVTGTPIPGAILNVGPAPYDVAIDRAGNLWTIDGSFVLKRFSSSSVVVSGNPTPQWARQLDGVAFDLAFNLPDPQSPIVQ